MNPTISSSWNRLTSSFTSAHLPPIASTLNKTTTSILLPSSSSKHQPNAFSLSELSEFHRSPMTLKKNASRHLRQTITPSDSKLNQTFSVHGREVVDGLSDLQLKLIYEAKCEDLKIQVLPLQEKRFVEYCCKYLKNRDFNFRESGIGPKAGVVIAECLRNNPFFCKLTLPKNVLGDTGAVEIAKVLSKAYNVIHLDVSSNSLSPEGLTEMMKVLATHESLVSLDISSHEGLHRNRLGPHGARAVSTLLAKNSILISLNLSGTAITPEGLDNISLGLSLNHSVQILGLANNGLTGKGLERFLKAVYKSKVIQLNLACNMLGCVGAEALAGVLVGFDHSGCRLRVLDLSETRMTFQACEKLFNALTRNNSLDTLILEENPIGAQTNSPLINFLCDNFTLRVLNMSRCGLRAAGAYAFGEGLGKNHSLKVLLLASNALEVPSTQDEQMASFSSGLARNSAITTLDLSNNRISDQSGLMICSSLRTHPTIAQLILKDNDLKEQSAQLLADMTRTRRNLVKVNVENNPISYKYVVEIRENVSGNVKFQGLNRAPGLLRELRELRLQDTNIEVLLENMTRLQKEETLLLQQIDRQKEKYGQFRTAEEAKTELILQERRMVDKEKERVMEVFYGVLQEIKVITTLRRKISKEIGK